MAWCSTDTLTKPTIMPRLFYHNAPATSYQGGDHEKDADDEIRKPTIMTQCTTHTTSDLIKEPYGVSFSFRHVCLTSRLPVCDHYPHSL